MTSSTPSLWIAEVGEGRARVHLAGTAHLSVPVVELGAGDSYKGVPYEVWAPHLGETVDVAMLERESPPQVTAPPVDKTELDELVRRLRRRAACLFAIPAVMGTLWVVQALVAYPYWGYTGVLTLYYLVILVPIVLVWCRITWLMLSPGRMPTLTGSILGWVHVTVGAALVLIGLRGASGASAEYSGAYLGSLILVGIGAVFFEGGRSYVRLAHAQEHAASARETTGHASAE